MNQSDLQKLSAAVEYLLQQEDFSRNIERLQQDLANSTETFVWSTVELDAIPTELPTSIKSGWIFHLRQDVPSGAHYHPNSIQHMIMVSGKGTSLVGDTRKQIIPLAAPNHSLADKWYVIDQNVPHEFFPEGENMTVISFHTCSADELEEVACETGGKRLYEGSNA